MDYIKEYELPESFFMVASDGEPVQMFDLTGESLYDFFSAVSHVIAWDDFNNLTVVLIVFKGKLFHYEGWQPGMHFQFTDAFTGEVVYDNYFPEWDH